MARRDVSDETDQFLRETEELNQRIVEAMPGGIVHVLTDGTIVTANPEALRILGLGIDELTGRVVQDFETETIFEDGSPCSAEAYPVTQAIVTGERQGPVTIGIRRIDGRISWAVFNAVAVRSPRTGEVSGAVVTFLDITDRKRAELEQDRLRSQLVLADRMASIGTLAAGVAHEINNPLTYVITNLQLLEAQLAHLEDSVLAGQLRSRMHDAHEGLERIRNVVRDLGSFSHEDPHEQSVDVHQVLESSLRIAGNELRYRARVVRDYGQVPAVVGNASRLGQVFLNLIVNASQAISAGNVEANEVKVSTRVAADGRVQIEICDTGTGVDPALVHRVFEPFVTTKDVGEGTGLGLHICHNIIVGFGGEIAARNNPGGGATFCVTLPAGQLVHDLAAGSDPAIELEDDNTPSLRILIVDDEPGIRKMFVRALPGHEVVTVDSGRSALATLATMEFDLVFCDLLMPDVTGMDVYEDLAQRNPELASRFVFMTGGAFTPRAREFVDRAPSKLLYKPFGEPDVRRAVLKRAALHR
ncbi:MAG TPA: ATP-binding protein [Kofleriaceae bacterium]|nr:ATP-binding protein [Kofleriaceae bacterium]